jgi:signal transduction histidine kinase/FixJ family two-component response regulator
MLFAKNTLFNSLIIRTIISLFLSIFAFCIYFYVFASVEIKNNRKKDIKEHINIILDSSEYNRLENNFRTVLWRIYKIGNVSEVLIIDKDCNLIGQLPYQNLKIDNCQPANKEYLQITSRDISSPIDSVYVKLKPWNIEDYQNYFFILLIVIIFIVIVVFWNITQIKYSLKNRLDHYFKAIISSGGVDDHSERSLKIPQELNDFYSYFINQEEQKKLKDKALQEILLKEKEYDISKQVAHDIRSPLAALEMAVKNTSDIEENTRLIVRAATDRISDIANDLLRKVKLDTKIGLEKKEKILMSTLCSEVISEKRMQFRNESNLNIDFVIAPNAYGLFTNIRPSPFKRILSNIINNSVEGLSNSAGNIVISLRKETDFLCIEIIDNGKGIPKEIIKKLGKQKISYNKVGGHGMGLSDAFTKLADWDGEIQISSQVSQGTKVEIKLPLASPPKIHAEAIHVKNEFKIVIVDDDQSIHSIWNQRFNSLNQPLYHLTHFKDPVEFLDHNHDNQYDLYLIDYEFIGHRIKGSDLIERIANKQNCFLVTSRFEDDQVLQFCEKLDIKLIPKGLASMIPIINQKPNLKEKIPIVLIDDDRLVQLSWQSTAKKRNIPIQVFDSISDFLINSKTMDRNTIVYVDKNLGDNIDGVDASKCIYEKGFKKIIIASGEDNINLPFWISGAQGKTFPVDTSII